MHHIDEAVSLLYAAGWVCVWEYPSHIAASHPKTGKAHTWPIIGGLCELGNEYRPE